MCRNCTAILFDINKDKRKNLALITLDIDKQCNFIKASTPLWKGNVLWRDISKEALTYLLSLSMLSPFLIKIDLEFDPSL